MRFEQLKARNKTSKEQLVSYGGSLQSTKVVNYDTKLRQALWGIISVQPHQKRFIILPWMGLPTVLGWTKLGHPVQHKCWESQKLAKFREAQIFHYYLNISMWWGDLIWLHLRSRLGVHKDLSPTQTVSTAQCKKSMPPHGIVHFTTQGSSWSQHDPPESNITLINFQIKINIYTVTVTCWMKKLYLIRGTWEFYYNSPLE